jgi:hypothetical protein
MTDPWHTLTVTATYGHRNCDCGETCKGHAEPEVDQDPGDIEVETELTHPDDCPPRRPCCCPDPQPTILVFAPVPCDACKAAAHEYCAKSSVYRCGTDVEIGEYYTENELPKTTGVYRVRGWWSSGGYYDEPESGVECEPMPAAQASEP